MNVKIYDNGKKVGMKSAGLWMIVRLFAVFPKMLTYLPDNTTHLRYFIYLNNNG